MEAPRTHYQVSFTAKQALSLFVGLLAALAGGELVPGRASLVIRAWTPLAKLVQRARGNGRVAPPTMAAPGRPRELP